MSGVGKGPLLSHLPKIITRALPDQGRVGHHHLLQEAHLTLTLLTHALIGLGLEGNGGNDLGNDPVITQAEGSSCYEVGRGIVGSRARSRWPKTHPK